VLRQIALAGCAALHAAVLFRPGRGQPVPDLMLFG
jgi:hypothetical protein